jgi:hypothetical protein
MFARVRVPMLLCPARNDPQELRDGGRYMEILRKVAPGSESVLFYHQLHGFANRADLSVDRNQRDYDKFMDITTRFLRRHLVDDARYDRRNPIGIPPDGGAQVHQSHL